MEDRKGAAKVTASEMVAAALAAHPGTAVKSTDPVTPSYSAEIMVSTETEGKLAVYVDPYTVWARFPIAAPSCGRSAICTA
ncbi:putative iron-regulated membrane protein [Rhizobium mongolense]|uniref:Putative iron-regulated membrane protein n=1 Tax=Rhizobium mongolense TaxID=57676 RepID=A0A7W6WBT6_9HYPH|nr:putative iron-regulated membrane protein [Rhizobium mongolense]